MTPETREKVKTPLSLDLSEFGICPLKTPNKPLETPLKTALKTAPKTPLSLDLSEFGFCP